jgi:DNA-binding transcriptional ArsR family regulator
VVTYEADAWTALGDPTRRAIFERIAERPQAVVEIARGLPVSRPAVSQHLKVLKDAGLVIDRKVQNRRVYQLNPNGLAELRAQLDQFWTKALAAYKDAVEKQEEN